MRLTLSLIVTALVALLAAGAPAAADHDPTAFSDARRGDLRVVSGTSMATPHTAGVAALYLQGNPGAAPATVRNALFTLATKGSVTSAKTANNHLLFTNF